MKNRANHFDIGYDILGKDCGGSNFYFLSFMNDSFSLEIFKVALLNLHLNIIKLSSKIEKGILNDIWKHNPNFREADLQLIEEEVKDSGNFKDDVYKAIGTSTKIHTQVQREYPLLVKIFKRSKDKKVAVLYSFNHCFCDGRGGLYIINLLGDIYLKLSENKEIPALDIKWDMNSLLDNLDNFDKYRKYYKIRNEQKKTIGQMFKPILDNTSKKSINEIRATRRVQIDDMEKVHSFCKHHKISINDYIILIQLLITNKYDELYNVGSKYIGVSFNIDLRRYMKSPYIFIGNFASFDFFIIERSIIHHLDIAKFRKKINICKSKNPGLGFVRAIKMTERIPSSLFRILVDRFMSNMNDGNLYRGLSSSNCGEISKFIGKFGKCIDDISFIPAYDKVNMPNFGASSYNGKLTINISQECDEVDMVNILGDDFIEFSNMLLSEYSE